MTAQIPVKYRDSTSLGEFVSGDQMSQSFIVPLAGENSLINGNFDVWQRGASFSSVGYTADRWRLGMSAITTPVVSQTTVGPGDTNFQYSLYTCGINLAGNSDATNHYMLFEQRIENVNTHNGKTVSFGIDVYNSGSAGRQIAIELGQYFGSGGSSVVQGIGAEKFSLAAGLNRIVSTIAVPSTSGKTVGAGSYLSVYIWLTSGTSFNSRNNSLGAQAGQVYLGRAQLREGTSDDPYKIIPLAETLAMCQRYYENSFDFGVSPANNVSGRLYSGVVYNASNGFRINTIPFMARKRIAPAMNLFSPSNSSTPTDGHWAYYDGSGYVALASDGAGTNTNTFLVSAVTSGRSYGQALMVAGNWAADSEL